MGREISMTTIATDGKTMAADTQMSGGYIDRINAVKVGRNSLGMLFGAAGCAEDAADFMLMMKELSAQRPMPRLKHGHEYTDFDALVVFEGKVYWYGVNGVPVLVGSPAAIGSGQKFAMAAMLCGKTPREAVEIAMLLDQDTGGGVIEVGADG
jgi:ATP-dependent protease HslVU (ClpYQ) peptidase subunit